MCTMPRNQLGLRLYFHLSGSEVNEETDDTSDDKASSSKGRVSRDGCGLCNALSFRDLAKHLRRLLIKPSFEDSAGCCESKGVP